ncbi:MAG TPA: SDR family oxidoreductase [Chloroflexota bacterium]|jgi:3-oxoacyl-[acyl-carrier protein] reductase
MQPLTEGISSVTDLRGRVALVTGAGRGIGRAIAEVLASAGADVAGLDLAEPHETRTTIEALGVRGLALAADVANREHVERAVGQIVNAFGRIDILVNNAGVVERSTLETLDDATLQRELDVIVRGTVLCTQAVYDVMKRQGGGKIVNISSISGKLGGPIASPTTLGGASARSGPAYALAKGGVIAFTKWVAKDAGHHGIHINAVCPGPIASDMTRGFAYNLAAQPIARMGDPRDVAHAVLFLASQMSNYVTGQTLNVDGGILMD